MLMLSAFAALQAFSSVGSLPCFQPVTTDAAIPTDAAAAVGLIFARLQAAENFS